MQRRTVVMDHEGKLSSVLSEFARTLGTDFPIQRILDHLVERIVEVLPISAAGVTLISAGRTPRYIAASDASALRYEKLQTEVRQGPCLTAYDTGEAVAVPDLVVDEQFPRFAPPAIEAGLAAVFTFPLRHGDGRLGALDLFRNTPGALDGEDMEAAQTLADVTAAYLLNAQAREEAHATATRFHHIALHDPLTGLPNRLLLEQRLEHASRRASRSNTNAAVLFADLDRFKEVNDTFGHQIGDELLVAVARRLAGLVRPGDTLARVSGDEFVFLCEDLTNAADVEILARRIDAAFIEPFLLADTALSISASVGMAFAGAGKDISEQLVDEADIAMYQAKRKGGGRHQIIDIREAIQTDDRNCLERDLRVALDEGQLDVAYQPIVRNADGLVTGVEALLRWTDPQRGAVSPMAMVTVAEQSGLIDEIGVWVLEHGCRDHGEWLQLHPGSRLDLAVNVSTRQLMNPEILPTLRSVLDRTGMAPTSLILEMTENIFIEDGERAITVLTHLRDLGIRLALDDFGTGYSSLEYLRRLPVDIVKIDQRFIADIDLASTGGAIVAAVTDLAHVFGLTVTAEGVETESQREAVSTIGCEAAQGYFFARPMAASAFTSQLDTDRTNPFRLPLLTAAS
jgi:diguanylate cyclase (GGDEF)-like protein